MPQGSILGPLLYLIYVNDFYDSLNHSSCILFADDTTLVVTAKNFKDLYSTANSDLSNLYHWLIVNKLSINLSKTKYIQYSYSTRSDLPTSDQFLQLNGEVIERVEHFKFLGFTINEHLSWKPHMLSILSKIQRNVNVVRKLSYFLIRESKYFNHFIKMNITPTSKYHKNLKWCDRIVNLLISTCSLTATNS